MGQVLKNNILDKIKADKELLETMPVNNEKNTQKYNEKIQELEKEYAVLENQILNEIEKRFNSKIETKPNKEIQKLQNELENYENIIEIINNIKTPYEKSNLSKETYRLGKYYKENLENVNNQILICVNILRNLGIEISAQDFTISDYAKEYMEVFFSEMKIGDIDSDNIKNKFEEIYWKCPDLITHIELNIKEIYMNNLNIINKYYEKKKQEILSKYKIDEEKITEQYYITKKELEKLELINRDILINKFLSGELNVKDYTQDKINSYYEKILDKEVLNIISENKEKIEEADINILKFKNSIYEYKKYLEYKFIIDEVIEKYKEKDKYKSLFKEDLKKIKSNENKIKKINKKSIFGNRKNNNQELNNLTNELKNNYKAFIRDEVYSKIANDISNATSLYSLLNLASCFYEFLVDCITKNNKEIEQVEIDKKINELIEFIKFPYFTIINNIYIDENKDIALIIKDRYKLLNFNIEKEDLAEDNLDNLLNLLEKIKIDYAIKKAGLKIEEITNLCEFKRIIEENKKNSKF